MLDLRQRPFLLIASLGIACSMAVAAGGWVAERARLGADDREAFAKVEQLVRAQFDRMARFAGAIAAAQAATAEPVLRQPAENRDFRPLFDQAARLVSAAAPAPVAVTVYSLDGNPLAWAGRPSELTLGVRGAGLAGDRGAGPSSLFVAPGPLGFRLVRVEPVLTGTGRPPARVGIVAAERVFSEQATVGNASAERFTIDTALGPVTIRALDAGGPPPRQPFHFVVQAPSGEPLIEAIVDPGRAAGRARRPSPNRDLPSSCWCSPWPSS